jgi:hypothetical protein
MDSRRMQELNREAHRQRLDWVLINTRREAIAALLARIKPADEAAEIQALVARAERMPWGVGCPKPMALSTALNDAKSLLIFNGKSLSEHIEELRHATFTDEELSSQFCDSFSTFKNLASCVIAAPGALRKLKGVIKWEVSQVQGSELSPDISVEPVTRDDEIKRLEVITNLPPRD